MEFASHRWIGYDMDRYAVQITEVLVSEQTSPQIMPGSGISVAVVPSPGRGLAGDGAAVAVKEEDTNN